MGNIRNTKMPKQRLSFSKKTKSWRKNNLDHADKFSLYHNDSVRQSLKNKVINLNLHNGIVNVRDMSAIVNPAKVDADFIPDNIPHHPIMVPKIDLLVGEEAKRRFDFSAIVTNPNAITKKETDRKEYVKNKIVEFLQANYEDEELDVHMRELERFMKYEWQDIREKMANQILRHYWEEQRFATLFTNGFKDVMIMAEEIYQIDIVANEPFMTKLNPLKVRTVRSGNSNRIEDANIIIIEDHWDPAKIIDTFYEELKPKDIDYISDYSTKTSSGSYTDDDNNHLLLRDGAIGDTLVDDVMGIAEINGHQFGSDYTDSDGNIRVLRVYWKSYKKIFKVKFYDEEGEVDYKIMSEEYIPDESMGEEAVPMWVNEVWEGTKIGKDIYIKMKPKEVQYQRLNNASKCHAGIIGQIYNTNQGRGISLVDRMKNYQYMYDAIWDRTNKAIASNYGKLMELDIAKIPSNWEVEKWLHFAYVNKIAVVDSFKEGNHGASTGKLSGSMNTTGGRVIDMETGSYIQQHINMLEFIKAEMGEISGVSAQRQGQISNRETVGGVERAVNQSSHVTEYWFMIHEEVKLRALTAFLEAAKYALKGTGNKKAQYILDDQTVKMLEVDADIFCDADYGVVVSNTSKTIELEQMMKQQAQALLQNGGSLSTIMDIYLSPSLSDMRRKIEIAESEINDRNAKSADDANKAQQAQLAQDAEMEKMKLQLEDDLNLRDNETKIKIAEMNNENNDGDDDTFDGDNDDLKMQLERDKFNSDVRNNQNELMLKMRALDNDMLKHADNIDIKEKQLNKPTNK